MTDTAQPFGGRATTRPEFRIRRLRNRQQIDSLLSEDRAYAAYALGHLEAPLFERADFYLSEGEAGSAVVLHATAMGPTLFLAGDPMAVDAVLSLHEGPRYIYLSTASPEHLDVLRRRYRVADALTMRRWSVTRAGFAPMEDGPPVRRLHGRDAGIINALYATDGAPSRYSPDQIDRSIYYGIYEDRRLVSIAGTHLVSPEAAVGIVGNVLTHPNYRGRGYAERVTSRVTEALFEAGCSVVALTADPANTPAVQAYERLGYRPGAIVVEAHLHRRSLFGIRTWWRRTRARRETPEGTEERATGRGAS